MTESLAGDAAASPLSMRAAASLTSAAVKAARQLLTDLERGRRIDAKVLRVAMEAVFSASDAAGAWNWKTAYDVCEAATILFLREFGPAIRSQAGSTAAMLPILARIVTCLPSHTRRSEDSQAFQQFSTPIPLGLESNRVYRLQTDAGERVIGRKVSAAWVANVLTADAPRLAPDAAFAAALMEGRTVLELAEGLQLRRVRVKGACRIELSGFNDTMRDRLGAYGLFGEIISLKLRIFVPMDTSGVEILSKVLASYPVARIGAREAA